ncbi:hypothetical protein [Engelhardtia mirabilis]|uniref:Uncharacterized protein n=1 Tax=Engelhardtia mirabilis TaxID=2528011 RepID=A0A518BG91_9BACT|nr:hypothetical protein Pla133_10610 [Planctomycetes bacterium Pla133]QDV00321.1 hypothetical protein Pla86_10600 [Planctomycetes bacterium Pla86]
MLHFQPDYLVSIGLSMAVASFVLGLTPNWLHALSAANESRPRLSPRQGTALLAAACVLPTAARIGALELGLGDLAGALFFATAALLLIGFRAALPPAATLPERKALGLFLLPLVPIAPDFLAPMGSRWSVEHLSLLARLAIPTGVIFLIPLVRWRFGDEAERERGRYGAWVTLWLGLPGVLICAFLFGRVVGVWPGDLTGRLGDPEATRWSTLGLAATALGPERFGELDLDAWRDEAAGYRAEGGTNMWIDEALVRTGLFDDGDAERWLGEAGRSARTFSGAHAGVPLMADDLVELAARSRLGRIDAVERQRILARLDECVSEPPSFMELESARRATLAALLLGDASFGQRHADGLHELLVEGWSSSADRNKGGFGGWHTDEETGLRELHTSLDATADALCLMEQVGVPPQVDVELLARHLRRGRIATIRWKVGTGEVVAALCLAHLQRLTDYPQPAVPPWILRESALLGFAAYAAVAASLLRRSLRGA